MIFRYIIFVCLISISSLASISNKYSLEIKSAGLNNLKYLNKIQNGINASIKNQMYLWNRNRDVNLVKNLNIIRKSSHSKISNNKCINCRYHTTFKLPVPLRIKNPDRIFTINNIHGIKVIGNLINTNKGSNGNVQVNQNQISGNAIIGNIINTNIMKN